MIIKPKKCKGGRSPRRPRFRGLVTYMLKGKGTERCTWYGAGNLEGIDRPQDADVAIHVVEAFQRANTRVKGDRTYHMIISFHPDDRSLREKELAEVVRRAVDAVGFSEHQYIAVRHSDQEHEHIHVAVNQIHPQTLKVHHPWRDVDAFKALASELEVELGLHRVDRAPSRTQTRGAARDYESMQGLESFARWAKREISGRVELSEFASWNALHERLAEAGVRLVRRGNGLALVDARRPKLACEASALGREWSRGNLTQRLGAFREGPAVEEVLQRAVHSYEARPLQNARDDGLWKEYLTELEGRRSIRREARERLTERVQTARQTQRKRFKTRHHVIQAMPIEAKEKRALYKMLATEKAAAERSLKAKIKTWRQTGHLPAGRSWKAFLAERAAAGDPRAVRRLARRTRGPSVRASRLHALPSGRKPTSRGSIVHNLPNGARLRESAGSIELLGEARDEALEQLVKVAKQRFGSKRVTLLGRKDVQRRLTVIAAERGLEISQELER